MTDQTPIPAPAEQSQTGWLAIESAHISHIDNMDDDSLAATRQLLKTWRDHYPRNIMRTSYYLAHYGYKGVAYSIPDSMRDMAQPMIGWPNKAVRALADLSVFEGFDAPDSLAGRVTELTEGNMLDVKVSQGIVSAYTHGCSFLTVSAGEDGRTAITPRSADWSAALWDWTRNRIKAALTITDKDEHGQITGMNVWLPYVTWECRRDTGTYPGRWTATPLETGFDRPTVVPLVSDEQLNRPFGSSRITRPLMALTDLGLRTMVRMEATAEFYSAPRIWFLGTNKSQVSPDTWSSIINVINGVPIGKNGTMPEMRQLTQASMQPHSDMLKSIALMVAAETDIPATDLGITIDNPASAEAMAEAERKLARTADRQNRRFGRALKQAIGMALAAERYDEADIRQLHALWAPTKETSDAARADYYAKIASVNTSFADSDVGLSKAGLSAEDISRQRAWEKRQRSQQAVDQLRAQLHVAGRANMTEGAVNDVERPSIGQPQSSAA